MGDERNVVEESPKEGEKEYGQRGSKSKNAKEESGDHGRQGFEYEYQFSPRDAPSNYHPYGGRRPPANTEVDHYSPYYHPRRSLAAPPYERSRSSIPPGRYTLGGMGPEREAGAPPSARPPPGWEDMRRDDRKSPERNRDPESEAEDGDRRLSKCSPRRSDERDRRPEDSPAERSHKSSKSESEKESWAGEREYGYPAHAYGRQPPQGYYQGEVRGPPGRGGPYRGAYDPQAYAYPPGLPPPPDYFDPYYYGHGGEYGEFPPPHFPRKPQGGSVYQRSSRSEGAADRASDRGSYEEYDYGALPPQHALDHYHYSRGSRVPPKRGSQIYPPMHHSIGPYSGRYPPTSHPGVRPPYPNRAKSHDSREAVHPEHSYPPYGYSYYGFRRTNSTGSSGDERPEKQPSDDSSETEVRRHSSSALRQSKSKDEDESSTSDRAFCTCKKSRCLKLYCQCFAAQKSCQMTATDDKGTGRCRCSDCKNNSHFEDERQSAIAALLTRNPSAFETKIQEVAVQIPTASEEGDLDDAAMKVIEQRGHKVGCKCRRSACLKKYCECFNAKVPCSANCRCVGCKNMSPDVAGDQDGSASDAIKHESPQHAYFAHASARYGRGAYQQHYRYEPPRLPPPISPSRASGSFAVSQRKTRPGGTHAQMVDAAQNLTSLKQSPQKSVAGSEGYTSPGSPAERKAEETHTVTHSRGSQNDDADHPKRKSLPNTPEKNKLSIPSLLDKISPDSKEKEVKDAPKEGKGGNSLLMAAMAMTELLGGKGSRPASPSKGELEKDTNRSDTSTEDEIDRDKCGPETKYEAHAESDNESSHHDDARYEKNAPIESAKGGKGDYVREASIKREIDAKAEDVPLTEANKEHEQSLASSPSVSESHSPRPSHTKEEEDHNLKVVSAANMHTESPEIQQKTEASHCEKISLHVKEKTPNDSAADSTSAADSSSESNAPNAVNQENLKTEDIDEKDFSSTKANDKESTLSARRMSPRKRKVSETDLIASASEEIPRRSTRGKKEKATGN